MLARRLDPPRPRRAQSRARPTPTRAEGRWRVTGRRPTRDPRGHAVHWWHRPPPRGDDALWCAVKRLHEERLRVGLSVTDLRRRLEAAGHPLRRETLSRILHGKQATSWAAVDAIADVLGVALDDLRWPRAG